MDLDRDTCYRALASRDARFDGRFFTAVETTGIYCRPVCPARTPRRANVRFYACAAAAEEAGFRPCLRCRPDSAPGSPAWIGTHVTVRRALRLVAEGALDHGADGGRSVAALAASLGIGDRHLRRLLQEELGASPLALALTRRVHFARKLVEETDLSMLAVAQASGFGSLRAFNAAFKKTFQRAPREMRPGGGSPSASLSLRLPYEEPFALDDLLTFLSARATPGVEEVHPAAPASDPIYRRSFSSDGRSGVIEVRRAEGALELSAPAWATSSLLRIVERVRRIFDLDADPERIDEHLARDRRFARLVRARPGLRVPGAWDGFELAVRAILGQQVSVKGATTLAGRLAARFGARGEETGGLLLYPERATLARAPLEEIGLPRARAAAIRALAASELTFSEPDLEARLVELPGIGPWTASYIALRSGEPDAFPASDLVLRRALGARAEEKVAALRPWRGYAAMHLWRSAP